MAKFYLSYKNEDAPLAKSLADQLESLGQNVIYDALAVEPGSNWRDVLLRALSANMRETLTPPEFNVEGGVRK